MGAVLSPRAQDPLTKNVDFLCVQLIALLSRGLLWADRTDYALFRVTTGDTGGKGGYSHFHHTTMEISTQSDDMNSSITLFQVLET